MKSAFPYTVVTSTWDNVAQRSVREPSGTMPGMTTAHYFLGHILGGLASNPTTMLNMEEHLEYAIRLAKLADEKTSEWA